MRASYAFSIDIVEGRLRASPFTQTDYQSFGEQAGAVISARIVRYTLHLETRGNTWAVTRVTGS